MEVLVIKAYKSFKMVQSPHKKTINVSTNYSVNNGSLYNETPLAPLSSILKDTNVFPIISSS